MSETCDNCSAPIKTGLLSHNGRLSDRSLAIINLWSPTSWPAACHKCGDAVLQQARSELFTANERLKQRLIPRLKRVPLASIHSPQGWEYEVLGIATAQSTTGTGLFSDVTSAFTDLFGAQSNTYNTKIRDGEQRCGSSLRKQALERGGNAVIAVDVDYAEVGGQRAMLMVCMTGTIVNVTCGPGLDDAFFAETAAMQSDLARIQFVVSELGT